MDLPLKNIPCDSEPIHLINELQDYGVLLIVSLDSREILAVSENSTKILSLHPSDLLGKRVDAKLPALGIPWDGLTEKLANSKTDSLRFSGFLNEKKIFITLRRSEAFLLVELESDEAEQSAEISVMFHQEMMNSIRESSLQAIFQSAVNSIRKIIDFDRVVLYFFYPDFSGEVLAESKNESMESLLGFHYPSTDIPLPARKLYEKNPIRCIHRRQANRISLARTDKYKDYEFHLGDSSLRAPHNHHIEYLTNMGIATSMSISIVCEGKLWGLFICHDLAPKIPAPSLRQGLELYSALVSMQIDLLSRSEKISDALEIESSLVRILQKISKQELTEIIDIFESEAELLRVLLKSDGIYYHCLGRSGSNGEIPSDLALTQILAFLETEAKDSIFSTNQLGDVIGLELKEAKKFPGLLSLPLSSDPKDRLVWFRKEMIATITWAGNPEDTFTRIPNQVSPRTSFEKFIETVKGKSRVWSQAKLIALESFLSVRETIDKKKAEAELEITLAQVLKSELELKALNQTKDKFFSIVSHNLRNPFSGLLGFSDLLMEAVQSSDTLDKGEIEHLAKNLRSSSYKAFELLKNLFEWGKIQQGKITITMTPLDFAQVLGEVVYYFSPKFKEKQIALTVNCPDQLKIVSDNTALVQVFNHLVSNALKYSHRESEVKVDVRLDGDHFWVEVHDFGVGMSQEDKQKLFLIDSKFRNPGTEKEDGTGLGLIITKEYLNLLKGEIQMESEKARGTKVRVKLPIELKN